MKLPKVSLKTLTDKNVLIGLALGAGVYYFTSQHHAAVAPHPAIHHHFKKKKHGGGGMDMGGGGMGPGGYGTSPSRAYFPHYDAPGLYELGGPEMRFSGSAELQRRLTIS